ncbi:NAD(P)H-dependent flavin oxidoreductase [Pseudoneobacillus sp. C159]
MFLVSSPELVINASKKGIIGSFPLLNARTSDILEQWLIDIKAALPTELWAVNFISHQTNKRFYEDLEFIRKYQPPIVITSLGHPGKVLEVVHEYGGFVYSDVTTIKHAKKAAETGVDGLILVCNGAGGHAGILNPFSFIAAVNEFWSGTIILAGGMTNGKEVLAAKVLGADLVYMGTRFIVAEESVALPQYKEMIMNSTLEDLIYTDAFSGVHANYLIPSLVKEGIDVTTLKPRDTVDFSKMSEAKAWRDIWSAGQGVTTIREIQPVADIIDILIREYEAAKRNTH